MSTATNSRIRVRVTRRGRVVLAVLTVFAIFVVALGVAALVLGGAKSAQAENIGDPNVSSLQYVTAHSGDSLWAMAERIAPEVDPRVTLEKILDLNGLTSAMLRPGQRIALPITR